MQAIQAIENPALEVPRRSSPFRALIWKEWQQQRWIFLSLAALAYALLLSGIIVARSGLVHGGFEDDAAGDLYACAALLGIVGILILSANAFSGEREDNTEQFLDTIPCSRSGIFWAKFVSVLVLVVLGLAPLGIWAFFFIRPPVPQHPQQLMAYALVALAFAAGLIVLVSVPALMASICGSVISTILLSIPVAAGCVVWMVYAPHGLAWFGAIGTDWTLWLCALVGATLVVAAWRLWAKAERTWRRCTPTLALTAGLLFSYALVPILVGWLYVTFFAPLSFFLNGNRYGNPLWGNISCHLSSASPDGESVLLEASSSGWGALGERAALVNLESGEAHWLTRIRPSFAWRPNLWTPSGSAFVLEEREAWLWPLNWLRIHRGKMAEARYFVVDTRSGTKHSFDELCPGLPKMSPMMEPLVGWYGENIFSFTDDRAIFFVNVEHHTVRQCNMPPLIEKIESGRRFLLKTNSLHIGGQQQLVLTDRGVLAWLAGSRQGGSFFLRFAPELPEAEPIFIRGFSSAPWDVEASQDGQWLLQNSGNNMCGRTSILARLENESEGLTLLSENAPAKGQIAPSWRVNGFVPNTHQVLLYHNELRGVYIVDNEEKMGFDVGIGLFDADTHNLRPIPLAEHGHPGPLTGLRIQSVQLSPKGGFALVFLERGPAARTDMAPALVIVDLRLGTSCVIQQAGATWVPRLRWAGEDHLLLEEGANVFAMNRDGTGMRSLRAK